VDVSFCTRKVTMDIICCIKIEFGKFVFAWWEFFSCFLEIENHIAHKVFIL
jgi:hypothetical protein